MQQVNGSAQIGVNVTYNYNIGSDALPQKQSLEQMVGYLNEIKPPSIHQSAQTPMVEATNFDARGMLQQYPIS